VPDLADAVKLVTDPANVSPRHAPGPRTFAVNRNRVLRALRDGGAGKAEARELALDAVREAGGGAELAAGRGPQRGDRGERDVESWWIPADAVRF
jgi:hypothetical protein